MKMIMFAFLILIVTFQKSIQRKLNNDNFFEIKYEELLKQKSIIRLSQLASKIEYIQLETNENCMIYHNPKYYFTDNFIFVKNRDHILKFSSDGKFLKKIGSPGRGPGEIYIIHNVSIIPEKKLLIIHDMAPHKLLYFNFDGILIKTVKTPRFREVNVMNDNRYIAISQASGVSEKYTHLLLTESGDTLSVVKNNVSWKTTSPILVSKGSPSFEPFYTCRSRYYFKSMYNDTVYVIHENKIIPSYVINLGRYQLPSDKIWERLSPEEARVLAKNASNYCFSYVFEAGGRLFLTINYWGGDDLLHRYSINKKGFIANTDDRYSGVFKGYIDNDWDGGALFWPTGSINDNTVFMPIYVADLKNIINFRRTTNSLKTIVRFPDKRNQLEKMVSESDISDNPILMVVTLKSDL